ncbi:calcium-activated chloride channel regulator 1-like [Hyla sarda]|uniref:calcium-activated chloride channel regulator 1-like n=1 Tax=Hyla sarda TaxID=327740 RepID=UPI0024C20F62|nr:calcium-activated chloride channel regulator 1-like [Hyla sarda]XP_056379192.1 calcium-activated chloride channel regulator 1-like [Hyla sarda]XP_056379193.1 calcium-activated chloride channel regulator 1-like [Hyla sarda]
MRIVGILVLISALQVIQSRDSLVKLVNNGYEDIILAINPKIPENKKIIENIKKMVTDASSYMLQATENRVYIRSAKILIPNTWSSNSSYGRPKTESYDKADVIIADPFIYGDYPYTLQYGGCGERGKYIHLTPNFILNDKVLRIYGPRGRVLVHEWAHLRWGVFDEYNDDIPFYLSKQGNPEATRCPLSLDGVYKVDVCVGPKCEKVDCDVDSVTGLFEEDCAFYPKVDRSVTESVMFGQALDPVHAFCKESSHNKEAPNQQNRLCNQKSTWDVIMNSPDMKTSAPLANTEIPNPTFSLLQYKDRVVTLVLDVSGSMGGYDRISRLYQASEVYIMQVVESGSYVGIVTFSSDAAIQSELVKIVDTFQRENLKKLLPKAATGGTNICAGVRKGFEVNKKLDGSTYGTEIVLLTDGEDSGISSCFEEVRTSGAIIHTIALGNSADKALEQLSNITDGLQLYASDNVDANGLIDSFSGITSSSGDSLQQSIQIESAATTINANKCLTGKVTIDNTVGNDTFFLVTWTSLIPNIELKDPKGKQYQNAQFVSDTVSKSARLTIPGTAETGDWEYNLCNTHSVDQVLGLTVNSRAANPDVPPIIAETYMNADTGTFPSPMIIYATVTQGLAPVLGAKVTAFIEPQNGKVVTLPLLDNGAGADIIKNDGIYSRFFTDYNGNGRYNLKVRVESQEKDSKATLPKSRALYLPGYVENGTLITNPPKPTITVPDLNLGNFSRTASGGAFVVANVPEGPLPDVFKPSKITDLTAVIESQQVILFWTATGDNGDKGNASSYDLRMSLSSEELLVNFENGTAINISSLTPSPAGSREIFGFSPKGITIKNGTILHFALVAIDKMNLRSEPSNVARAALFIPAPKPSPQPTIKPGNSANSVLGTGYTLILTLAMMLVAFHL